MSQGYELALPAELGTSEADQLKLLLVEAQRSGQPVVLNGEGVKRIGAAALQLLTAFALDERKQGRAPSWQGASDSLRSAAELAGLTQLLSLQNNSEAS
jgi:chemotaxis protein CheX